MNFEFDENQNFTQRRVPAVRQTIADKVVSFGLAENKQQANVLLVCLIVVLLVIMFFSLRSLNSTPPIDNTIDPISGQPISPN